jgi:TrmH family RNA methyltransferase
MISKASIKFITSLQQRKYRRKHGMFVAEGTTNVLDFLHSGIETEELFATEAWIEKHRKETGKIPVTRVSLKELGRISSLKNPSEVLAVLKQPPEITPDLSQVKDLVLMLDDLHDPGNMGTIIRTADWFGIRTIICSGDTVDVYNPKVVQASMGSLARVQVSYADLGKLIKNKPDYLEVFGAVLDGKNIADLPKPKLGVIVIGSEAHGISDKLLPLIDHKITIPGMPAGNTAAESLNASIAAAIICYEFRR